MITIFVLFFLNILFAYLYLNHRYRLYSFLTASDILSVLLLSAIPIIPLITFFAYFAFTGALDQPLIISDEYEEIEKTIEEME